MEDNLRRLGKKCGGALKLFVIYDCCREEYAPLKERVEKIAESEAQKQAQIELAKKIEIEEVKEELKVEES